MQPIPQSNTRQNKRARKLHSSRPRHLERSRVSSQGSTGWSPQHILRWKRPRTGWSTRLSILKKTLGDATCLTTRSSNDRWEVAADIQTGEQYSSTGSINAQKHLATTVTTRKTLIVFLKMPTLIEAEAAIALTCFSNVNLESRMTPKIFNSETISTTEPSINKSGNKGSTVREREISIPSSYLDSPTCPTYCTNRWSQPNHHSMMLQRMTYYEDVVSYKAR